MRTTTNVPAVNATGVPAPAVISRGGWRADETIRTNERQFAPIRKLIVHHTASENRPADPAGVVRFTYRYHVLGRGFSDVGYNFMIDHRGRIYEGRYARRYAAGETITGEDAKGWGVVGAHAATMNHGSCGVCLIGNFEEAAPTDAAIVSLTNLLAWKAGRQRIGALEDDVYENLYHGFFQYRNLSGHRDVGETLCPGRQLYAKLGAVRSAVAARAGDWPAQVIDIPAVVRTERGAGPAPTASTSTTTSTTTAPTTAAPTTAAPTTTAAPATTTAAPATTTATTSSAPTGAGSAAGTKVAGYRAVTTGGALLGTSKVKAYGKPAGSIVALAAPGVGDGYATLTASGAVNAFGTVRAAGNAAGSAAAVDLAVSHDGRAAWVLRADGTVAPVGAAAAFGSPKKSGLGLGGVAIECRPGGDGYWVLTTDGRVRGYGSARPFGAAAGAGAPVDLAITAAGTGCFVLFDTGAVVALGTATHAGDLTTVTSPWTKPAAAITTMPSGTGYAISARDGGLFAFGGAPFLGSFAGSRATVVGVVVACR